MNPYAPTRFYRPATMSAVEIKNLPPQTRASYLEEKRHLDAWGHLPPQVSEMLRGVDSLALNAVENHAREQKTDPVHFAAARAYFKWPLGMEMSALAYRSAIDQVLNERHG